MSLKLRLNLMITMLLVLVMLLGALLTIRNAREDVRAEVESTAGLALHLLDAEILHYTSDYAWLNGADSGKASIFRLQGLGNVRHLQIEFYDALGNLRDSNRGTDNVIENAPPTWFMRMMDIVSSTMQPTHRPIFANGRVIGELVVTPDPSYEISEIWHDTLGLLLLVAVFFVVVNVMVFWAVNRALRPVDRIMAALTELELGRLETRLPAFTLPELASISGKFNAMAQTLQHSIQNNHHLTQRLIRLQEDERKSLARDLHDEIGQYLTAIHVDATAILNAKRIAAAHESALAINGAARQMMDMVHDMLRRLRPGGLDELGLNAALRELIGTWRQRNHGVTSVIKVSGQLEGINDTVAVAAYRIVQECLTNVARHAAAHRVTIAVGREADQLTLLVEDDGCGFMPDAASSGFGLAGMRERVEGLGGKFDLSSTPGSGVRIAVRLPCVVQA